MFHLPKYREPDFTQDIFVNAPDAVWEKVSIQGVAPGELPQYIHVPGIL